ncbi:MAG: PLP-dependent aminotransferase family protein [Acetobacteraceae bacterium]
MVKRAGGALLLSIAVDRASSRPIATQLYVGLRDLILSGAVTAGTRLPASRTLARDVGVSRTTVIDAFERLISDGILTSRVGSGTEVSAAMKSEPSRRSLPVPRPRPEPRVGRLAPAMGWVSGRLGERPVLPHSASAFISALPAFDAFPVAEWARIAAKHWRSTRADVMGYGPSNGLLALREAIVAHLGANRGIACEREQIFIVGGAQQAFVQIAALLLEPGDKVWFENPGAIGARNGLLASGARLVPVPVDGEGLAVAEGLRRSRQFRLAFVTPSHQQPLGHVMSLERRLQLLRAADEAGAWIVEDDYDGEFYFGKRPPATLKSVDRNDSVIYVGTFSKSLFPALRLGFMVVPPVLVEPFNRALASYSPGVPSSVQAIVAEFMAEGHFASHIRRMRAIYQERHDTLCEAARAELDGLVDVARSESGLHTVGHLAGGLTERAAMHAAEARHIVLAPLARFAIEPTGLCGMIFGFGAVTPPEIRRGAAVLASALRNL